MEHPLRKVLALADAEISPAEVPALIQELARNPALVRVLQSYLAVGRNRIAKAYAAKTEEPVPQWLVDTVMQAPGGRPERQSFSVVAFGRGLLERLKDKYSMPGWSLAAGPAVAAVLAAVSAWLLVPNSGHGETLLASQVQRAIETTRGGDDAALVSLRPVLTFLNKDQVYCRQFELRSVTERSAAIACREANGGWRTVMQAGPVPIGTAPASSGREVLEHYLADNMSRQLDREEAEKARGNG